MKIKPVWAVAALAVATAAGSVCGDSVRTKDGQTFIGDVVEETDDHIRVKTKYGEVTVPKKQIKKRERPGDKPKPKPKAPKKPDPRKVLEEHRKAMDNFKEKKYTEAIERYNRILSWQPDNRLALYNMACAQSLTGNKDKALDFLVRSVEAGFVNFDHMNRDTDLDGLREDARYKDLFARRSELVRKAMDKAVERISEQLKRRKIDVAAYKTEFDAERNFVYLHARDNEELALIRQGMEAYAEHQWKHLFQNKPGEPMYIILLTPKDSPKVLGRAAGGVYTRAANALFCGDLPAYKLTKTSVIIHEFTHALHYADQGVRRQQHPIWLVEGLATLFESAGFEGDDYRIRHNQRLAVVQEAVRAERSLAWTTMVRLNHATFLRGARLCYAQARYMLLYMHEKGLLKRFYDEYTNAEGYEGDKTAQEAFEVVFGKPMAAVESEWKEWALEQTVPPIPFLGVGSRVEKGELVVTQIIRDSGADKAGVKKGDVVVAVDGTATKTRDELIEAIGKRDVGEEIDLVIKRKGEELRMSALLGARPTRAETAKAEGPGYLGLTVEPRDGGVFAKEVTPGSPAAEAGIAAGVRILQLKGKPVESVRDYLRTLKECKPGDELELKIKKPGAEPKTVSVTLDTMP